MSKRNLGWTGWRDIGFFLHWEGLAVAVGGLGLAALEFWDIPKDWPLRYFVADYRIWIVVVLALVVGLPPTIARGVDHLRARADAGLAQIEVATALYGVEIRLMNLVSKLREAFSGHRSNTYQNHTLNDCKAYFATRAGKTVGNGEACIVEVNYYSLKKTNTNMSLTRSLFTGGGHPAMRTTFSTAGGASEEAKILVRTIVGGKHVFCRDVRDQKAIDQLRLKDPENRPYRSFLSVPVFRDKDSPNGERVIGMLSINSTHVDTLSASDAAIMKVYAWVLSAAFEADRLSLQTQQVSKPMSTPRASLQTTEMKG